VDVVCAEQDYLKDPTIDPCAESFLKACLRVPFAHAHWENLFSIISSKLKLPLWHKTPDEFTSWKSAVLQRIADHFEGKSNTPDVLVTFGQPMTDHLIGLNVARYYQLPWVAHFSDPWLDNPLVKLDSLTRLFVSRQESQVMTHADRLVFTSQETLRLVMARYSADIAAKARVLPHSFEPERYPESKGRPNDKLVIRYIGAFYGHRMPHPLFAGLRHVVDTSPAILNDVRFELIGWMEQETISSAELINLPEGLIVTKPPVSYEESLRSMRSADGLIVVDAQADCSVFLPSKLIDYIGAGRPILGITPPGTAASLIAEVGGWVANPVDAEQIATAISGFVRFLRQDRNGSARMWGEASVRDRFEAKRIGQEFNRILLESIDERRQ